MIRFLDQFRKRTAIGVIVSVMIVSSVLAIFPQSTSIASTAYTGIWKGRDDTWRGAPLHYNGISAMYFSGKDYGYSIKTDSTDGYGAPNSYILPIHATSTTQALPGYIDTVDELVALLKEYNRTTGTGYEAKWKRAGSAFIVHTMLGRTGKQANANGAREISDQDFADLTVRLNAAREINWNTSISTGGRNTFSVKHIDTNEVDIRLNTRDAQGAENGIVITSADGSQYKMWRRCANPIGEMKAGVKPPVDFSLSPSITNAQSSIVEPGSAIDLDPKVTNSGATSSSSTKWDLTQFQVAPGASIPYKNENDSSSSYNSSSSPCVFYGLGGVSGCKLAVFTGGGASSGTTNFTVGDRSFSRRNATIGDLTVGTRICYTLSVQPRANNSGQWRHSVPTCLTIGKKPKVEIWGSDLFAGKRFIGLAGSVPAAIIQTSTSVKDVSGAERVFGSWVEYGAIASGAISGIGSGSAFADPFGLAKSSSSKCDSSLLSFANSFDTSCNTSSQIGGYSTEQSIPDVSASFPITSSTVTLGKSINLNANSTADNGIYTVTSDANITGGGGLIGAGRWFVLNAPDANITITRNIEYTGASLSSINDIPQVVIIAKNIYIRGSVERVDAWLVAKGGEINTCSRSEGVTVAYDAQLSVSMCSNKLSVNGPVMATKLYLRRTAGSDAGGASGDSAEVFNLRADAYLWASIQSVGLNRAYSVYSTNLPPRL